MNLINSSSGSRASLRKRILELLQRKENLTSKRITTILEVNIPLAKSFCTYTKYCKRKNRPIPTKSEEDIFKCRLFYIREILMQMRKEGFLKGSENVPKLWSLDTKGRKRLNEDHDQS